MTRQFDLRQNAFVIAGLDPTASNQEIVEAFEDALSQRRASESDLIAARQALLVPKLRLEAELASLIDTPSGEARSILERLNGGSANSELWQLCSRLAPLSRLNLITHIAGDIGPNAELLISFVAALAQVDVISTHSTIDRARKLSGFLSVDLKTVREASHEIFAQHASSIVDGYAQRDTAAADMAKCTIAILAQPDDEQVEALETLLRAYRLLVNVDLSHVRQEVEKASAELRQNPSSNGALQSLLGSLHSWSVYCKPLQLLEAHKGRDEQEARFAFDQVRSLCIELANDFKRIDVALAIAKVCASVFKELPRASVQIIEDIRTLEREALGEALLQHMKAGRYSNALSTIDALLKETMSDEDREVLQNFRNQILAGRSSIQWRWGLAAAAAIVVFIVWAQQTPTYTPTRPRTTDYRPTPDYRPSSPNPPYAPPRPPYTPPSPPPPWQQPRVPQADDYSEIKPSVGRELAASRANIRYCVFQRTRLEAARAMIAADAIMAKFNDAVDDWNSRCGAYRYQHSDLTAVQTELSLKRSDLQAQAIALIASWTPTSSPGWASPGGPTTSSIPIPPPIVAPAPPPTAPPTNVPAYPPFVPKTEQTNLPPSWPPPSLDGSFEQAFGGVWAIDPNACPGSGKASMMRPMTLTAERAETRTGTCVFTERRGSGYDWNVKAECIVGSKRRNVDVNLVREGDLLKWTNEKGTTVYHRC